LGATRAFDVSKNRSGLVFAAPAASAAANTRQSRDERAFCTLRGEGKRSPR